MVALAAAPRAAGRNEFLHVTSMGADAGSRVFYNRVKGETERDVAAVGIPTTVAFRPSIIDGDRPSRGPGEQVGLVAMRALAPGARPVPADAGRGHRPGDGAGRATSRPAGRASRSCPRATIAAGPRTRT